MKIPKKLKIGSHTFKILKGRNPHYMGETDTKQNKIWIDEDMPQDQQEATLIHEIMHAINTTFGNKDMEHALLDSLSEQMYQVLRDNRLLK